MGCQVVSVYADESNGVIGYPEPIIDDLYNRNYCTGNLLKTVPTSHPYSILGFNQSFAEGGIFTYTLNGKEYFVYSASRFLVTREIETGKKSDVKVATEPIQRSLMHEDKIVAIDVKGKLCLTGTVGGRLILWDLQFYQQKINIKLPEPSINISSMSTSKDYVFCTDTQSPHNKIYCFDLRTCKLKSSNVIPSYQSMLKGISWNNNHHITVAADGVWFMKYSQTTAEIEVIKGMFRIFPKTSMTCLSSVDKTYVITGTVDGYVFLWAQYQCQKVIKVADFCVSEMQLWGNKLIVGNLGGSVRVFEYKIKKKKDMEEDEKSNGEITQDFVSVIIDSYEKDPLQSIVISKLDQSVYYAQTRSGLLYNKMIPSAEYQNKMNYYKEMDKKIIQFQKDTVKYINNNQIWLLKLNKPFFQIQRIETNGPPLTWSIKSRYISNAKKYVDAQQSKIFCLIPQIKKVCYAGINKIYLCQIADIEQNPDIKIDQLKETIVLQFEEKGPNSSIIRGLTSFEHKGKLYLKLYFETQFVVLVKEGQKWVTIISEPHDKQVKNEIEIDGEIIRFEERNHAYRWVDAKVAAQVKEKMSFMHCVHEVDDIDHLDSGRQVSLGGSIAIVK